MNAEQKRLRELREGARPWRRWGPYLSERSWGTVREDYSADGSAWSFLTHEMARSKAYRWGEDGLAGISDQYQLLCFAPVLWNGRDPMLKERLFGLTPLDGNHGEDVKEYYYYLDATPSHSYLRYLYKYPQAEFPYQQLIAENRRRNGAGPEYELLDTGVFAEDRYFDVSIEYAKADAEDICIRIEVCNRGLDAAELHVIPTLWFRNIWAWGAARGKPPIIRVGAGAAGHELLIADDSLADGLTNLPFEYRLGQRMLYAESGGSALFTGNETNAALLYGVAAAEPHVKDAFHRHIIHGEDCCNPQQVGTKAGVHYRRVIPAGGSSVWRLRLADRELSEPFADLDAFVQLRREQADAFYKDIHPAQASEDERQIQRQALAGPKAIQRDREVVDSDLRHGQR